MARPLTVFRDDDALIAGVPVGPFQMNQYLVACTATGDAALIDGGAPADDFVAFADARGLRITRVLQTHGHVDHVAGLASIARTLQIPIALHPEDRPLYDAAPLVARMYGFACDPPPAPDQDLADGDQIALGQLRLDVWHTPGHSPGHVLLVETARRFCMAGDLIFAGSIGRTDLPGCDEDAMMRSLRRALTLDDAVALFPGHMAPTTIGRERRTNPFLTGLAP